jgi:Na+/H+-dicarboxylate symporter/ABC-type amino acid transport substrate-binding protein
VLVGLWVVALAFAMLIPLTFPDVENASFFSTALVERRAPFNFIDLYIPSNPFYSLANNIVPAVVLFSVIVAVALIGMTRKQALLDVLSVAAEALSRATRFVVSLTPFGLFAIAAVAAGTLDVEQLGRLEVYLIAYVVMALLLGLWVLPGLVAALTPITMRQIFSLTRDALITAFVAGDLFIVLPVLIEASKTLVGDQRLTGAAAGAGGGAGESAAALPDVIVPVSFNFPHAGKLLSLSFILFAGWFSDATVAVAEYPRLAVTGLITFFGSLNVAVPFLLDLFRIPADTFQLFLATGVINSRFGTLVAASHTVAVALLGTCAMTGTLTWRNKRLLPFVGITLALTLAAIVGTRLLFTQVLRQQYSKDKVLAEMHLLHESPRAVVHRTPLPAPAAQPGMNLLDAVRARGTLRVGYLQNALPFAFFNARDELVGLDIDLAHRLSLELGVAAEFVPVDRAKLVEQLSSGYCDIIMAGVAVTTDRAGEVLFSSTYMDETVGLLVPDHMRHEFATWDGIRDLGAIRVAVPDVPYYIAKLRELLPRAHLAIVDDVARTLERRDAAFDAFALPAERGSAWTLIHPRYTVVVPEPSAIKVPLAYPIARRDLAFASFVNTWIDLKRKDGTIDALYRYWILGQEATARRRRWSILHDVLHWTES